MRFFHFLLTFLLAVMVTGCADALDTLQDFKDEVYGEGLPADTDPADTDPPSSCPLHFSSREIRLEVSSLIVADGDSFICSGDANRIRHTDELCGGMWLSPGLAYDLFIDDPSPETVVILSAGQSDSTGAPPALTTLEVIRNGLEGADIVLVDHQALYNLMPSRYRPHLTRWYGPQNPTTVMLIPSCDGVVDVIDATTFDILGWLRNR